MGLDPYQSVAVPAAFHDASQAAIEMNFVAAAKLYLDFDAVGRPLPEQRRQESIGREKLP